MDIMEIKRKSPLPWQLGSNMENPEIRFDHEFVDECCKHCDLSDLCCETECPGKLRAEVNRLYDFNEKGVLCSKHWIHPSKCCNGTYSAMLVSAKTSYFKEKELDYLREHCKELERKLKLITEVISETNYEYK